MEGLIPFVIHAIKKNRERGKYLHLPEGSSHAGAEGAGLLWPDREGSSSHHRRTRSEFHPRQGTYDLRAGYPIAPEQQKAAGLGPSRSLREDTHLPPATVDAAARRTRAASLW